MLIINHHVIVTWLIAQHYCVGLTSHTNVELRLDCASHCRCGQSYLNL